jgi:hypothetical protein
LAHWAEIDENNLVTRVLVGNNNDSNEGYDWLIENLGGTWVKTSYNTHGGVHNGGGTPLRKNYAGIGYTYDADRDAFIPPQPFASWVLNEDTCLWEAPVEYPSDGKIYIWDEDATNWVEVAEPTA